MLRRIMNLPLTVASRAAKAFQDREDARLKERYGTAHDPGTVPVRREGAVEEVEGDAADAPALDVGALRAERRPIQWVDVRDAAAFAAGHVPGALHMPMAEIGLRVSELPWDRLVVAVCDDGRESGRAVAFFRARGMEDTFVLGGGLRAWRAAGGEVAR